MKIEFDNVALRAEEGRPMRFCASHHVALDQSGFPAEIKVTNDKGVSVEYVPRSSGAALVKTAHPPA